MAETQMPAPETPGALGAYVKNVRDTAKSFWEGMSVTLSYMFRKPITSQYPDRMSVPVSETIPARYRGFLEVDMDICTACQACERACPISVINIDIIKGDGKPKAAGLDVAAMGRQLAARALQVKEDKPKLQKVLEEAMAGTDCGDCGYPDCFGYSNAIAQGKDSSTEKCAPGGADSKAMLETILVSLKTGVVPGVQVEAEGAHDKNILSPARPAEPEGPKGPPLSQTLSKDELYKVVLDAMAGTDCGDCEYPDCDGYTKGIVYEGQADLDRCAPGGEDTRVKLYEIMLGTKPPPK